MFRKTAAIRAEQQKTVQTVFGQFSRGHRSVRIPPSGEPSESPRHLAASNPSLQNRKTETLGILANDVNKDIVISAILVSDVSDEIRVERKLLCKNEFQSMITLNNQEVSQKELYDKFHLSSNMFDIGIYISQSESLDFLQNKYKNRKDAVSSLLDDTEITDKIQMLE